MALFPAGDRICALENRDQYLIASIRRPRTPMVCATRFLGSVFDGDDALARDGDAMFGSFRVDVL